MSLVFGYPFLLSLLAVITYVDCESYEGEFICNKSSVDEMSLIELRA